MDVDVISPMSTEPPLSCSAAAYGQRIPGNVQIWVAGATVTVGLRTRWCSRSKKSFLEEFVAGAQTMVRRTHHEITWGASLFVNFS